MTVMRAKERENRFEASDDRGFTLLEMLVAVSIFVVLVVAATDIFMMANRSQRKVFDLQAMQASSRFTLDAIVREIRTGTVDYGYYAGLENGMQNPAEVLALIDSQETPIKFYESDQTNGQYCQDEQSRPCLLVEVGSFDPAPLSPLGVKVRSANFFVSPEQGPFDFDAAASDYSSDKQPTVTVMLSLESVGRKSDERTYLDLQTTATSRLYQR